jgi:hypothetical protein
MRPGGDLDVFSDLAIAGDLTVMRPIQPDDLGERWASTASDFAPDEECRSRYRSTW